MSTVPCAGGGRISQPAEQARISATPVVASVGGRASLPRPEGTAICPRCGSDNTEFEYYNNNNKNQPRYLCKVRLVSLQPPPTAGRLQAPVIVCTAVTYCHLQMNMSHCHMWSLQACERRWTQGGKLRDLPVGSGRRKYQRIRQAREAGSGATAGAAEQQLLHYTPSRWG